MNYVIDICVILIFLFFIYMGYRCGIAKSIFSFISMILSFSLSNFVASFLASKIFTIFIRPSLFQNITNILNGNTTTNRFSKISEIVDCCPHYLHNSLDNYSVTEENILSKINLSPNIAAEEITDMMSPVFINFIRIITVSVLFLIFMILFRLITKSLCKIFRLPILKQANQLFGIVFGALKGIIILFFVVFIIRLSLPLTNESKDSFFSDENINKTYIFKLIYHNSIYDNIFNFSTK